MSEVVIRTRTAARGWLRRTSKKLNTVRRRRCELRGVDGCGQRVRPKAG